MANIDTRPSETSIHTLEFSNVEYALGSDQASGGSNFSRETESWQNIPTPEVDLTIDTQDYIDEVSRMKEMIESLRMQYSDYYKGLLKKPLKRSGLMKLI